MSTITFELLDICFNKCTSVEGFFLLDNNNYGYDFSINDGCIPNRSKGRSFDKIIIARGMFNYNWEINDDYIATIMLVSGGYPQAYEKNKR